MKTSIIILFLSLCSTTGLYAQQLGSFEPKSNKHGLGKLKKVKKKIYIAKFNVNYEVFKSSKDYSAGGSTFGGGVRGSAEASAAVGLKGISESDLQEKTDQLYQEYIAMLKNAGFEIISADEAGKTEAYENWDRLSGGSVNKSQLPGVLTVRPSGYDYFVKRVSKKGKEKTGLIANYPALSKDMNNAIIGEVDLTVMFSENGKQYFKAGGFAKVKIKTNLRVIDNYTITAPKKSIMKGGGIETINVTSRVAFYSGKIGLASLSGYDGILKKPLEIENVIPEEKIVAMSVAKSDAMGTDWGVIRVYSAEASETSKMQLFDIDSKLYSESAYQAVKKIVDTHTKGFLESL